MRTSRWELAMLQKNRHSLQALIFLGCLLVVGVPLMGWYVARMGDGSDEPFGILALAAWFYFLPWKQFRDDFRVGRLPMGGETALWILVLSTLALVPDLPSLVRSGILVGAVSVSGWCRGMARGAVILGFLSLPILASLDFYLGFPLRWACGWVGTLGLNAVGLPVSLEGIRMIIDGKEIVIDRPCTGLKYLWFGWFFSSCLVSYLRFGVGRVFVASVLTGCLLFLGNALRITILFLLEWRGWGGSAVHEGVGLLIFGIVLVCIFFGIRRIGARGSSQQPGPRSERSAPRSTPLVWLALLILVSVTQTLRIFDTDESSLSASPSSGEFQTGVLAAQDVTLERAFSEGGLQATLYRSADSLILVREIPRPTRKLHSAEDCFRGDGWKIETAPLWKDPYEHNWRRFYAERDGKRLEVRQRIVGEDGWSGTDVSEWFWNAVSGKTKGPWKAWVVVMDRV